MLKVTNLSYSFPGKTLFENATFSINNRQKTALVGPNGSGKSSLIKIILKELEPESGQVTCNTHIVFGYVAQVPAKTALTLSQFLQKNMVENYQFAKQASRLGLIDLEYSKKFSQFSGGELSKIMIAVATINNPNFLILDEPTNHLDKDGITWLISYLKEYLGAVLVVSHDRKFLDEIVDSVVEIDSVNHQTNEFGGNYSDYKAMKTSQLSNQMAKYKDQELYKARIQRDIESVKQQAIGTELNTKLDTTRRLAKKVAKKAKSRENRLEKQMISTDWIEKPQLAVKTILLNNSVIPKKRLIVKAVGVDILFSNKEVIYKADFAIYSRDRIICVGPNGSGKTSLLRLLRNDIKLSDGHLENLSTVSYLSQEHFELPSTQGLLEYFRAQTSLNEGESRGYLDRLVFMQDQISQPIKGLSAGEITKLELCITILQNPDLLLLDEPTNHLDVSSIGVVQKLLQEYRGAFIVVTHDQELINSLQATSMWSIVDKKLVITENI
ncbi:ABC-F family ATP-binding cassette domain-containing protein [Candidatus Saccharibacteria bacterium]|nr:ABC-F family ATP-binding cassette domain-containing protein [Candidatus Saccharibacteria bacterium]